jgi:eukaryotic-like serine/threonine-protein kinase
VLITGARLATVATRVEVLITEQLATTRSGQVFACRAGDEDFVCRWFYPQAATRHQRERIGARLRCGDLGGRFVWPLDLVEVPASDAHRRDSDEHGAGQGFGYLVRPWPARSIPFTAVTTGDVGVSFADALVLALDVVEVFADLAANGLCFADFDPGDLRVVLVDNRVFVGSSDGIVLSGSASSGAARWEYAAPEVLAGGASSATSDQHVLAVVLFELLMLGHPFEGRSVLAYERWDDVARRAVHVDDRRFVFDPDDTANRPDPHLHPNLPLLWPQYPEFVRSLFVQSFVDGSLDPAVRVTAESWRSALRRARDLTLRCGDCGRVNFHPSWAPPRCWSCGHRIASPLVLRTGDALVVLDPGRQIRVHHLRPGRDAALPVAVVERHATAEHVLGLRNLGSDPWTAFLTDGSRREVRPGRAIRLDESLRLEMHGRVVAVTRDAGIPTRITR